MTMNDAGNPGGLSSAELFRAHAGFVARFLYRLGVPAQAIDDAVQDVFVVVHQRGGYRPGAAKPTTYLALIASHAASVQRRKQRLGVARRGDTELDELAVPSDDPAVHTEHRDELRRMQDALALLEPSLRDTLLLAECEEETAPAIADAMGVPVGTVYWRLHEARKKFQRALAVTDRTRARAAATRLPGRRTAGDARAKLSLIFALFTRDEQRAGLREALRAWQNTSFDFALERGLQRHLELIAALPAAALLNTASKLTLGTGSALQGAAWLGTAACALLVSYQLLTRSPAATGRGSPAQPLAQHTNVEPGQRNVASTSAMLVEAAIAAPAPRAPSEASAPDTNRAEAARTEGRQEASARRAEVEPSAPSSGKAARGASTDHVKVSGSSRSTNRSPRAAHAEAGGVEAVAEHNPPDRTADAAQPAAAEPPAALAPAPVVVAQNAPAAEPARPLIDEQAPVVEAQALARADSLLATQPAKALAIVEQLSRSAPHAYLAEERQYIQVMALYGVGRRADADRAADGFLAHYPTSIFRERMKAARRAAAQP